MDRPAPERASVRLETPRLRLCEWEPDGWLALCPIAADPEVMRYIGSGEPWSPDRVQRFVTRQIAHAQRYGFCLWSVLDKQTEDVIGLCGLQPLEGTEEMEIGWWLARTYWRRGLATEAAKRALTFGFGTMGLQRIIAIVQPGNRASIRVIEKLGMSFEREGVHNGVQVLVYSVARPPVG